MNETVHCLYSFPLDLFYQKISSNFVDNKFSKFAYHSIMLLGFVFTFSETRYFEDLWSLLPRYQKIRKIFGPPYTSYPYFTSSFYWKSFEVKSLRGSTMENNAKICEKYCCKEPRCAAWVLRLQSDATSNCPAGNIIYSSAKYLFSCVVLEMSEYKFQSKIN